MSVSIHRYEVPIDDKVHSVLFHGEPLAMACRHSGVVEFWALHLDHFAGNGLPRWFTVVGTAQPLPEKFKGYIGTAVAPGGSLVWHLIEVRP